MSDIKEAMRLIGGVAPSPEQVRRVQSIAHSLGIPNNDPLMMQYVALDCYFGVFSELPQKINDAVNNSVKTAEREADLVVNDASKKVQTIVAGSLTPLAEAAFENGVKKYIDQLDSEARHAAIDKTMWIAGGAACLVLFFGLSLGWGFAKWSTSNADTKLAAAAAASVASVAGQLEKKDLETAATIANLKAEQALTIANLSAAKGWAGTAEGQLAYKFFTAGSGAAAAKCQAAHWTVGKNAQGQKLCIPQHEKWSGWTEGDEGWVIP